MKAIAFAAPLALLALAGPASAHHSGAMFDREKTIAVQGVVKSWSFSNPHTWLEVVEPQSAGEKLWGIEGSGASGMMRAGMTRATFKPGDKLTVQVHPLKDGRPGGSFVEAAKADGTVVGRGGF